MTRAGIRGGNIRSVQQARDLHGLTKPQVAAQVSDEILRALIRNGEVHPDDLQHLAIPEEHLSVIGAQFARLRNKGAIREIGRRKCANPASNGRKAVVWGPTEKVAHLMAGRSREGSESTLTRAPSVAPSHCLRRPVPLDPVKRAEAEDALIEECERQVFIDPSLSWDQPEELAA